MAIVFVVTTTLGLSEPGGTFQGSPAHRPRLGAGVGLWMTFKGVDRTSPIVAAAIAETEEP